jgi:hypothetical protein
MVKLLCKFCFATLLYNEFHVSFYFLYKKGAGDYSPTPNIVEPFKLTVQRLNGIFLESLV